MFTLRDPRLDAISRAGGQLGTNLGDTLVQGIMNKRMQGVLGDITPTTPINEVMSKFAGANVPQEMQQQYFNPQIQQRVAQERRKARFADLASRQIKPGDMPQFLAEVASELADTEGAGDIMKVFMTAAQSANLNNGDGNETPATDETANRPGKNRQTPTGRAENPVTGGAKSITNPLAAMGVPGMNQMQQGTDTGDYRSNINVGADVTPPMGPQEYQQLLSRYAKLTGDYEKGKEFADKFQGLTADQRAAELDTLSRQENQRQTQLVEEERSRGAVEKLIGADAKFPGQGETGTDVAMRNIAVEVGMRTPGTDEQKFNAGRRAATRIFNNLNSMRASETRPRAANFQHNALQEYLRKEQNAVQNIMNDSAIPENLKPEIAEQIRLIQAGKGNGPVETEYLINPPSPATTKLINSVQPPPRGEIPTGIPGKIGERGMAKIADRKNAAVFELADTITRVINTDPKASPVIMRDRFLDKGWDETDIKRAFTMAEQSGAKLSDYQREQMGEISKPQRESLRTFFGGDKAANDYWDMFIRGRR